MKKFDNQICYNLDLSNKRVLNMVNNILGIVNQTISSNTGRSHRKQFDFMF